MIRLVVGLGNPGRSYQKTRHNLGFRVVDLLSQKYKKTFKGGRGKYVYREIRLEGIKVYLLKPLTFMNNSGQAVLDFLGFFSLTPPELFVICDDVNLPLGKLRIREKGSDGGHKGFPRLRLGIGPPPEDMELEDFVLEKFRKDEKICAEQMIQKGVLAAESSVVLGLKESMNSFNQQKDSGGEI
jgi:PTH1 family peptidyl-tRNA hydrolase